MTYWCTVRTHARAEDNAAFHLRRQGYDVFLPKHLQRRKHARLINWVPAPIFPRYLFVAIDPETTPWRAIRSTIGVSTLISFGTMPARVPDGIIAEIRARQDDAGFVKMQSGCGFKRGDRVRIIDGPLNNQEGLFECTSDQERVTILLELLGREVKVRVPLETVYTCV